MTAGRLSLIINTYEQPQYLARVLAALAQQSSLPDEVIVADDGSSEETREVIGRWSSGNLVTSAHLWQKHEGFRRARILNQAIARAGGDYLVFLDGDTVPHPEFVVDHRRLMLRGVFVQGHRALVKEGAAAYFGLGEFGPDRRRAFWGCGLAGWKQIFRWPRPWVRIREDLRGIRGCNLGVWRDDLVRVNGYNEAFVGWGREDSELAARLKNAGVRRMDVRGWALCYHLWHPPASRTGLATNDELLAETQRARATRCEAGVDQYLRTQRTHGG